MSYELVRVNKVNQVLNKVPEFKGMYSVIDNMDDRKMQSQVMNIILSIDTKPLDINTLYGWNQHVRRGNIKKLILKGVLPNDDNLEKYQDRIKGEVKEQYKNLNLCPVMVKFYNEDEEVKVII